MSKNKGGASAGNEVTGEVDEVEELLRAAQDHLLLNLNLNSHLAQSSSSSSFSSFTSTSTTPIDDDLLRRFEALKSPKIGSVQPTPPQQKDKTSEAPKSSSDSTGITQMPLKETRREMKTKEEEEMERILGADLSARFAALKGSVSSSSSTVTSTESQLCPARSNEEDDGDEEEDEVDKVIQWAIDAARLDPSSPTDDDEDDDSNSDSDDDDDEEDDEKDNRKKQQEEKKKK